MPGCLRPNPSVLMSKCLYFRLSSTLCIHTWVNPDKVTDFSGDALDAQPQHLYHTTNCLKTTKQKKAVFPSACYKGEEPHSFPNQIVPEPARAE